MEFLKQYKDFNAKKFMSTFETGKLNGFDAFINQSQTNVELALKYFNNCYDEYIDDTLANLGLDEGDFTDVDWKYYIEPYCKKDIWC